MSYAKLTREQIAQRIAHDIPEGAYVNLGIGMPTLVANHLPKDREIFLHSENGILGMGPAPAPGLEDPDLINAGKEPVTLLTGGAYFHHTDSFAMMRGGHLDICVLGAFQVSAAGDIANWHTGAKDAIPAVGGAMDLAVEFTSMSKTYSMPGWRIGFAVGNERIIAALGRVKSYLDYGAFTPIQVAATAAINGPDDCIREMRATYRRRRDVLVESFGRAGWEVPAPRASMFAWAPIPEPFQVLGSVEFAKLLVEKAEVAVSPGTGFGERGEGFVRFDHVHVGGLEA